MTRSPENSLTPTQRLLIKRATMSVNFIEKESDKMIKYELFQRFNTGVSVANYQEVRNCLLMMLNEKLYNLISSLAQYEPFKNCIILNDRLYEEQYDVELVLRFVILFDKKKKILKQVRDVNEFLTEKIRDMALDEHLDYQYIEQVFKTTFDLLNEATGENSFMLDLFRNQIENAAINGDFKGLTTN